MGLLTAPAFHRAARMLTLVLRRVAPEVNAQADAGWPVLRAEVARSRAHANRPSMVAPVLAGSA